MTKDEATKAVNKAFRNIKRPAVFIRNTCCCEECSEHNDTLSRFTPETITIDQLGNPGWDPICFANDQAFKYYLPAMIRLSFDDDYIDQLIFHLNLHERLEGLNSSQAIALRDAIQTLLEANYEKITDTLDKSEVIEVINKLDQVS